MHFVLDYPKKLQRVCGWVIEHYCILRRLLDPLAAAVVVAVAAAVGIVSSAGMMEHYSSDILLQKRVSMGTSRMQSTNFWELENYFHCLRLLNHIRLRQ